jgi:hypothetical protein
MAATAPLHAKAHATAVNYVYLASLPVSAHWGAVLAASHHPNAANDDYVILFKNAATGGVRECGNLSNYCIDVTPSNPTP